MEHLAQKVEALKPFGLQRTAEPFRPHPFYAACVEGVTSLPDDDHAEGYSATDLASRAQMPAPRTSQGKSIFATQPYILNGAMPMIEKILFPVDFSQSCVAMAPYVKRAADMFGAQVSLVHVCDLVSHNGFELYVRPLQGIADEHWCIGEDKLKSFLASEFPPSTCARILRSGEAAAQIAEVARTGGFDGEGDGASLSLAGKAISPLTV